MCTINPDVEASLLYVLSSKRARTMYGDKQTNKIHKTKQNKTGFLSDSANICRQGNNILNMQNKTKVSINHPIANKICLQH